MISAIHQETRVYGKLNDDPTDSDGNDNNTI